MNKKTETGQQAIYYCETCDRFIDEKDTEIRMRKMSLTVGMGEEARLITKTVPLRFCKICGEEVSDEALNELMLEACYYEHDRLLLKEKQQGVKDAVKQQ